MAMTSASPANPDLPRQSSSLHLLHSDHSKNFTSMNMDELLKNIYSDSDNFAADQVADGGKKTVDEVWKELVNGNGVGGSSSGVDQPPMSLEDYLSKAGAGALRNEDVKGVNDVMGNPVVGYSKAAQGFGNGNDGRVVAVGGGRGKRRAAVEEVAVDKATQQKQRRMIKNRESAARSRERKQAYTVELENIVMQLEEENERLLREEAEQTKERFKQLMENLVPVVEKKRPPRALRRVESM